MPGLSSDLLKQIESAFPPKRCDTPITRFDNQQEEEFDEDQFLFKELSGRIWREVPVQFVREHPNGLVLLTREAFVAFLPAWLAWAVDDVEHESEIRNFTIYTFVPKPELIPDRTSGIRDRVETLSLAQRDTLRAFLAFCAEMDPSPLLRAHAARAVEFVDSLAEV